MHPLLRDGDVVTVDLAAFASRPPAVGDVVLARHPFKARVEIVKRVAEVTTDGRIVLHGEDPLESQDSRGFGPLDPSLILGLVRLP